MKSSRLLLILFVILGLFGSDICAMKRTQEGSSAMGEIRDPHKEEKERKAKKQEEQRVPVSDDCEDESMEDQSDDSSVQEVAKLLEIAKLISDDKKTFSELKSEIKTECSAAAECSAATSSGDDILKAAELKVICDMSDDAFALYIAGIIKNGLFF